VVLLDERRVHAQTVGLRDRRADPGKHRERPADRRPDRACRRIEPRLRVIKFFGDLSELILHGWVFDVRVCFFAVIEVLVKRLASGSTAMNVR
jgi:hypothetical protein